MSDFKGGGIKTTDYDSYNTKYITQKTEFIDDVYVFGKLYADLGGDVQTFSTAGVERLTIQKDGQVVFKNIGTSDEVTNLTVGSQGNIKLERNHALLPKIQTFMESGHPEIRFENSNSLVQLKVVNNSLSIFTNNNERFEVDDGGQVVFVSMTQNARDALNARKGGVIFNSDTNKLQCWNGSSWNNLF